MTGSFYTIGLKALYNYFCENQPSTDFAVKNCLIEGNRRSCESRGSRDAGPVQSPESESWCEFWGKIIVCNADDWQVHFSECIRKSKV